MRIAVPRETAPGERRVALVPESCKKLMQAGYEIAIQAGAGDAAGFGDEEYTKTGRRAGRRSGGAARFGRPGPEGRPPPTVDEVGWMRPGAIYVGSLMPLRHLDAVRALAARKITAFATDAIPRTTRAQSMDTLSSMANLGGYKGVLLAAVELNRYFPMLTTAAGMVFPAKVFVIGAGVAGLQAIATAKRLGANVVATDVRPEVKEQIESVGAKYVGIELERERGGGRRLRQGAVGGGPHAPGRAARRGMRPVRRRHHDGADRRRVRAAAHLRRRREDDEAGIGDRRSRRPTAAATASCRSRARPSTSAASRFSRRSTCRPRCRFTRACCSRAT